MSPKTGQISTYRTDTPLLGAVLTVSPPPLTKRHAQPRCALVRCKSGACGWLSVGQCRFLRLTHGVAAGSAGRSGAGREGGGYGWLRWQRCALGRGR